MNRDEKIIQKIQNEENLSHWNSSNLDVSSVTLSGKRLIRTKFDNSNLSYANLNTTYLFNANLTNGNLRRVNLKNIKLEYANLTNNTNTNLEPVISNNTDAFAKCEE
jgi:uncharacterized protein YjbI with pentapeptide repeats